MQYNHVAHYKEPVHQHVSHYPPKKPLYFNAGQSGHWYGRTISISPYLQLISSVTSILQV